MERHVGMVAGQNLPAGSLSKPQLSGLQLWRVLNQGLVSMVFELKMENDTVVSSHPSLNSSWLSYARPAGDCHEQNAELLQHPIDQSLYVRLLRDIAKGDEIRVWFSADLVRQLEVPFLQPTDIKGPGCYTCNRCGATYNQPNPLKVHLRFFCTSEKVVSVRTEPTQPPSTSDPMKIQDLPKREPVSTDNPTITNNGVGHVCSYCGKTYSRRYGLKIHVRTHTGYKPLHCTYCGRPFSDPSNLNKHVRLHADTDTPYRCRHCGKILVRRRDLDRHVRSRHPDVIEDHSKTVTV